MYLKFYSARLTFCLFWLLAFGTSLHAQGQPQLPPPVTGGSDSSATINDSGRIAPSGVALDDRYRIGPGDVLDIRVFNKPQFSREGVRVDSRGMVRVPLISDEIQAACRTEAQLGEAIKKLLQAYVRNPQVDVFIRDYQSQPVSVIGAVRAPSQFKLQRRVRLLELLSFAGGTVINAGQSVQVVHTAGAFSCDAGVVTRDVEDIGAIDAYKLSDTLLGTESANPFVRPGDIVNVPEADQVYIVGNVFRPSAIPLREPITVSRAIAIAGGTQPDTKSSRVRIIRQLPGNAGKKEIIVDLGAIDKQRQEDVLLQANDIVNVPTSTGKQLFRGLISSIIPNLGSLPVRVIP